MLRKRRQAPAPSTIACSCSSLGMVWRPARKMTISVPIFRQAAMAISDGIAQVVLWSQFGQSIPTQPSTWLTRPLSGWRRNRQTTATATMLVTTGV